MEIKDNIFKLSAACSAFNVCDAEKIAFEKMSRYCECEESSIGNMNFVGLIKGKSNYTIMLDAHIDEVSFVVTDIDDNGFLTVSACGGIDIRTLPAKCVTVHGKEKVKGVFINTPPHLSSGEVTYDDIKKIKIDTAYGNKAKEIISVGDIVTYCAEPKNLIGDRITGKALDDRVGVAILIELAKRLSGKALPVNVVFSVVDGEELGMRGAVPATFDISPDEAIAIDVTFASANDVSDLEGGILGGGAMVGISPVLSKNIGEKLNEIAYNSSIPYQSEIMGGRTGTDGDVISISGAGVKTGLISVPLRNMHTDCEIVDMKDVLSVCDILEKYILEGGLLND